MSVPPQTSAASRLNPDVLWHIFMLNADNAWNAPSTSYASNALTIARRTSHVCRMWRDVMIHAASLWGKIINFRYLAQKRDEWRDIVFRRTKSAPLYILADIEGSEDVHERLIDFLLSMLDTSLDRVVKLDIRGDGRWHRDDERWGSLKRPAPSMEYFFLNLYPTPVILTKPNLDLFAHQAGRLHFLSCRKLNLTLAKPFAPRLRILHVDLNISFETLLNGMKEMPLLEILILQQPLNELVQENTPEVEIPEKLRAITLPHLREITIWHTITPAMVLLPRITAAPGCCIRLFSPNTRRHFRTTNLEIDAFSDALQHYTRSYVHEKQRDLEGGHIKFIFNKYTFEFLITEGNGQTSFQLIVSDECVRLPPALAKALMRAIGACSSIPISSANIKLNPGNFDIDFRYASASEDFKRFLLSLDALEEVDAQRGLLEFILDDADRDQDKDADVRDVFPALHTLKYQTLWPGEMSIVHQFLTWRREIGMPVIVLNLEQCPGYTLVDCGRVERIPDLTVVGKDRSRMTPSWISRIPMYQGQNPGE
ncbi:hypothetical protein BDZ97DRAFT_2072921 [Flammula alnicola]|nr:hypothetical protein BDZ97DRAFT_2072921 [Flammula alnicola]